jgi:hypothetical protein
MTDSDNLTDIPAVADYKAAFLECRGVMTEKQLEMLKAHYHAPEHTIAAGDLARAVGFPTVKAANLRYGKYADAIGRVLGRTPKVKVTVLASISPGEQPGDEFLRWTLRPQAVAALEELGWVRPRRS